MTIPGQIPLPATQKVIWAVGQDGYHGSAYFSGHGVASRGQNGQAGQNATSPTDGAAGRNISVALRFDPKRPACVQVVHGGQDRFEISSEESLLLNAQGGAGGNGGIGEPGQHGGRGIDGADATRYSSGQDGGPGGNGGDGGYGTSGADGGSGGSIYIRTSEHELDLLLAVGTKVKGGSAGNAGQHGAPGDGGAGGRGGNPYYWTESETNYWTDSDGYTRTDYRTIYRSNPGGRDGPRGRGGRWPGSTLTAGRPGPNGSTDIEVVMGDGTTKSYPDRYRLVVDGFEVVDENNDGINEPGEHLIVENIIVRNHGPMPSPSGRVLKIVIKASAWLAPDISAPLILPDSIPSGGRFRVPGKLRAFIRHESAPRPSGQALYANETVSLQAYSERLNRIVPEFSGGVPIIVQYPLQMSAPQYMDCMTKGDEMTVAWLVQNISKKPYGATSITGRAAKTKLTDLGRHFVLESAAEETNFTEDAVDHIESQARTHFCESFTVAGETRAFSTGSYILELYLADPFTSEMRRIMHFNIAVQISEGYAYSADSRFLLVVNASTPNDAIIQMQKFIKSDLHLGVDIFNISLTGNFIDDKSGKSVLLNYKGKSIIISGNPFSYFNRVTRNNWDLIDPHDALFLSMNHTGFLFCGVLDQQSHNSLTAWTRLMKYPGGPEMETADTPKQHKDRGNLLKSVCMRNPSHFFDLGMMEQYTLSKSLKVFRGKTEKRLQTHGNALSKELDKKLPMRRFLVGSKKVLGLTEKPSEEIQTELKLEFEKGVVEEQVQILEENQNEPKKDKKGDTKKKKKKQKKPSSKGVITMVEGLSRTAKCIVSYLPIIQPGGMLTQHQVFMMIASLPSHNLATMFWNVIRSVSAGGISAEALYRDMSEFKTQVETTVNVDYEELDTGVGSRLVSNEVCTAVAWAIERDLDSEIEQLCRTNPTIDSLSRSTILDHTPRIRQFLNAIPKDDSVTASEEGIKLAVDVLSFLTATLKPRFFTSLSNRQAKLRGNVSAYHATALSFMVPPAKAGGIKKRIRAETKKLRKDMKTNKAAPKTAQTVVPRKLEAMTGVTAGYLDICAAKEGSIYLDPSAFQSHIATFKRLLEQQRTDTAHAQQSRDAILATAYTETDFISLTTFS